MEKNAGNLRQRKRSTKTAGAASTNVKQQKKPAAKSAKAASPLPRGQAAPSAPGNATAASGDRSAAFTPSERIEMIAIAAYHRAEHRNFSAGSPEQDWLEAEAEIDGLLDRQR